MAARNKHSLPSLKSARIQELKRDHPDCYAAYDHVLRAEERALQLLTMANPTQRSSIKAKGELVAARVAGCMLLELISQSHVVGVRPSTELVEWLTSKPQDPQQNQYDVVIGTGTLLSEKLIRVFRTSTPRYPPSSSHPSCPAFDTLQEQFNATMESTGKDYRTQRKKVLARDGYRCVVTGIFDLTSFRRISELAEKYATSPAARLEAAHIFNESMVQSIGSPVEGGTQSTQTPGKRDTTSSALTILKMFGLSLGDAFAQEGGVHESWNMIMLGHDVHTYFDALELWFEPTDKPHRYKVCTLSVQQQAFIGGMFAGRDRNIVGAPDFVEFNAQIKEVPPPDPFLLALHGICARVAHMSGAAEFFDEIERDAEETMVLAFDGSSAPLLSLLLSSHAIIEVV